MMDCKFMATPMVTYLRKLREFDYDPVNPSLYWQLIRSLMYLVNTKPDICIYCEHVEPVPGGTQT
jgi:hypothetical protein